MRSRLVTALVGLLAVGLLYFGWEYYRDCTLSPGVKAAISTAISGPTSGLHLLEYNRTAHLASRTKRDFEVISTFDRAMTFAQKVSEHEPLGTEESYCQTTHDLAVKLHMNLEKAEHCQGEYRAFVHNHELDHRRLDALLSQLRNAVD